MHLCVRVLCSPVFLVLLKGFVWLVKFCFFVVGVFGCLALACWVCVAGFLHVLALLRLPCGFCDVSRGSGRYVCCLLHLLMLLDSLAVSDVASSDRGPVRITCHAVPSFPQVPSVPTCW